MATRGYYRARYTPNPDRAKQALNRLNNELDRRDAEKKYHQKKEQTVSLENYEPVAVRLDRVLKHIYALEEQPQVITHMLSAPGADICVFRAELYIGGVLVATGHAEEVRGQGNVNKTSHVENCETSALGRMCESYQPNPDMTKRPSREEMHKVQRMTTSQEGNTTVSVFSNAPSEKQVWLLKKLLKDQGKLPPANLASLDKFEVSRMIEALKNGEQPADELSPEEPF